MAVKTVLSIKDIENMLLDYSVGDLICFHGIQAGTVESNVLIKTTKGKYVLRYYEKRTADEVLFEEQLLIYLKENNFPCTKVIASDSGDIKLYKNKPYMLFEYEKGEHQEHWNQSQWKQVIQVMAQLHNLTQGRSFKNAHIRNTYDPAGCMRIAAQFVNKHDTQAIQEKWKWYQYELKKLVLPDFLPKAVCHSDYHYSNILFKGNSFGTLLDFDDANYTYQYFDIVSVTPFFRADFDHETWMDFDKDSEILDFTCARDYLREYQKYIFIDKQCYPYFYDLLKLSVLVDCLWYFDRGLGDDFFEKRKINAINRMGRTEFQRQLFEL